MTQARRRRRGARRGGARGHRDASRPSSSSTPSSSPSRRLAEPDGDGGLRVYSQGQGVWDDRRQIASLLGLPEERSGSRRSRPAARSAPRRTSNVQGHAALLASSPAGRCCSRCPARRACASTPSATRSDHGVHGRLRRRRQARGRARPDRRRHRRVRERRRQGARARRRARLQRVRRAERRRRGAGRLHEQSAVRRDARVRRQPVELRDRGLLDMLAEKVGIDGWEIRWRNALDAGDRFGTGQMLGAGRRASSRRSWPCKDAYERRALRRASPAASRTPASATACPSAARRSFGPRTTARSRSSTRWTEMGQGVHTVLQQIACEELGLPPERITRASSTPSAELDTGQTTASRVDRARRAAPSSTRPRS